MDGPGISGPEYWLLSIAGDKGQMPVVKAANRMLIVHAVADVGMIREAVRLAKPHVGDGPYRVLLELVLRGKTDFSRYYPIGPDYLVTL
jgi:hypothetical protein